MNKQEMKNIKILINSLNVNRVYVIKQEYDDNYVTYNYHTGNYGSLISPFKNRTFTTFFDYFDAIKFIIDKKDEIDNYSIYEYLNYDYI